MGKHRRNIQDWYYGEHYYDLKRWVRILQNKLHRWFK